MLAAFGTTFTVTGSYQKAGTNLMDRVTEYVISIQISKQKLYFGFSSQKASQKLGSHQHSFNKYCFIFSTFNKYLSRDTIPLRNF
jgi:hypothetical protein